MKLSNWAIKNPVPINLITVILLLLGIASTFYLKREMFPPFEMDIIEVSVEMETSSTPEQVDKNINQILQSHIQPIDGVKEIKSTANSRVARLIIELYKGYNKNEVKTEIEDEIDTIRTLPTNALEPNVRVLKSFEEVISIAVMGKDKTNLELRKFAEKIKAEMREKNIVSQVKILSPRPLEISVMLPIENLLAKKLSLEKIANQIKNYSIETSGGVLQAPFANISIKSEARKTTKETLEQTPFHFPNGELQFLKQLTYDPTSNNIINGFSEEKSIVQFLDKDTTILVVERSQEEDIIYLTQKVKDYIKQIKIPQGFEIQYFNDTSEYVQGRLQLILKNGAQGLCLVLLVLALFLEWKTAFWVALGILFSLIGSLPIMLLLDQSINMLSLFAFLIAIGIIVDDAIVIGEEFFSLKSEGLSPKEAAKQTVKNMQAPVLAMMFTTIVAFTPLLFVSGMMGKFLKVIPSTVIIALVLSLLESLFILPSHLAHHSTDKHSFLMKALSKLLWPIIFISNRYQQTTVKYLNLFSKLYIEKLVRFCIKNYCSVPLFCLALCIFICGWIPAGIVKTSLFPELDSENLDASIEFKQGTPFSEVKKGCETVLASLKQTGLEYKKINGQNPIANHYFTIARTNPYVGTISTRLYSVDEGREVPSKNFLEAWRTNTPYIKNLRNSSFGSTRGGPQAKPIEIELSSSSDLELKKAESSLLNYLNTVAGVVSTTSDNPPGPLTLEAHLKPEYLNVAISELEVISTISNAYRGIKIDTFYRDENEVKIWVKAALKDRESLHQLKNLRLKNGMTIGQIAKLSLKREPSTIKRVNGALTTTISADINKSLNVNAVEVRSKIQNDFLDSLLKKFPEISWRHSGESKEGSDSIRSLFYTYIPALLIIYLILSTIYGSYIQPIVIMLIIPFAFIGAVIGHFIMGLPLNLMSFFGIVALTGVAVNDALVLVSSINKEKQKTENIEEALVLASKRRFRPILLTSITTVAGLISILFETSLQAQFLIPLVTSLVFGIIFTTIMTFIVIPSGYVFFERLIIFFTKINEKINGVKS